MRNQEREIFFLSLPRSLPVFLLGLMKICLLGLQRGKKLLLLVRGEIPGTEKLKI